MRRNPSDNEKAAAVLRSRTTSVDEQVTHAYRTLLSSVFPRGMALVAVGGYGRRELFPWSDIDLLLLVDKEIHSDEQREALSSFLRNLWDGSLRLSQSVHTVSECTRLDESNIELSVSLLDARFLIGDSVLYEHLSERLSKFFRSNRQILLQRVCQLTSSRHIRFDNTIYHLEPDIKEGPGGLRDINVVHWLGRLRESVTDSEPDFEAARDFLWSLRCDLHNRAGRDQNVLTFSIQEEISPDPAGWMRQYFHHARVIFRAALRAEESVEQALSTGLIRSFRDWRSRLSNSEFTVTHEHVTLRNQQSVRSEPMLLFRLFEFIARHGIRLSLETERRVREMIGNGEVSFAAPQTIWPALRAILKEPHASTALHGMHETGLLNLLFPAWKQIESLVVRDFYHRYTVDEHTLIAVEHLENLRSVTDGGRRRFVEMLSETADVPLLLMAILFHDVGKSNGLEGHAVASAISAEDHLKELGMPEEERALVTFLVEKHLALSAVMNSRDLNDPATAADLAHQVETLEKLRYLTLLTYADISAVNPDAMTPWRLEQLWYTYLTGHRELTRELDTDRIHSRLTDEKSRWLEGFPVRYLRTHSETQIENHMALAAKSRTTGVAVSLERRSGYWHLTVITNDRPRLLAGLTGTLSAFGMNIVRAEAFANDVGLVLDAIVFEDPMRTLELNPPEADRLSSVVGRVLLGDEDVERLLRGRPRPTTPGRTARILPAVFFDNEASETATLVEIIAQDRPALLYDLCRTFSQEGCSIDVILIDTEAHKAIDVFYITAEGRKLNADLQGRLQARLLEVCQS